MHSAAVLIALVVVAALVILALWYYDRSKSGFRGYGWRRRRPWWRRHGYYGRSYGLPYYAYGPYWRYRYGYGHYW